MGWPLALDRGHRGHTRRSDLGRRATGVLNTVLPRRKIVTMRGSVVGTKSETEFPDFGDGR